MQNIDTISPALAFDYARSRGVLNGDNESPRYIGRYAFMGTNIKTGMYEFLNVETREKLYIPRDAEAV